MARDAADPSKGLEELLSSLRAAEAAEDRLGPGKTAGGTAPAAGSRGGAAADGPQRDELKGFLMRRIEALEKGLAAERERASAAESRAARQEANRGEVEEQLRSISDLLKRERDESHSRGRIEALESRLDKMHETWASALERIASRGEREAGGKELAEIRARLDEIAVSLADFMKRGELRSAKASAAVARRLGALEKRLARLPEDLAAALEKAASRREEASKAVSEELAHVREWVQKLAAIFTESMDGMGKEVERTRAEMGVIVKRLFEAGLTVEAAERRLSGLIRRER